MVILLWMSFMVFTFNWKHFLKMLLSIEMMVVVFFFYLLMLQMESILLLYFMIISIMSAIIGLTLLMVSVRSFGSDMTTNFMF